MAGSTNTAVDHRIQLPKAGPAASVDVVIDKARTLNSQLSDYVNFLAKNKQEQHVETGIIRSSVTKELESLERVKKILESDVSCPQSDPSLFLYTDFTGGLPDAGEEEDLCVSCLGTVNNLHARSYYPHFGTDEKKGLKGSPVLHNEHAGSGTAALGPSRKTA